jgi:hypothetical protein
MPGRRFCFQALGATLKRRFTMSQPSKSTGFIAFIPQQIHPSWHEEWGPKLAGFPLNIAYARARKSDAGSNPESVVYWLDPGAYRENSEHREMCYFTKHPNGYRVLVIQDKRSGRWRTEKFRGDKLICSAAGTTFDGAMIQTTMVGAEAGE